MASWSTLLRFFPVFILLFTTTHAQYRDGDVRLVGGSYQWEGRVEVYMSGVWGTITDSDWTNDDARVVCRKLGHFRPGATAHSGAYFGEGKGPVKLDSVKCTGREYILTDCDLQNSGSKTSHSLDVGVKCQPADGSYREGDIRLVGGPRNWEGRVEVFWTGKWGAISGSSWSDNNALVVCRQLQHASESGDAIACCGEYGKGSGDILIRNVDCFGFEENVTACTYFNVTAAISHDQDVGVKCQQGNEAREGEIRLNRTYWTPNLWEGRVEIFLSGEWGTVCDDGASSTDAHVVCRQLGYYTYNSGYRCCAGFGYGTGPVHFSYPACSGSEYRLNDCQNQTRYCRHYEDWGVYCRVDGPEHQDIRLSSTIYYGFVQVFLSGSWIPIADSNGMWNIKNSEVVCRQVGYDPNGTEVTPSQYSFSTYKTIDNIMCSGTESQLSDCFYDFHVVSVGTMFRMDCKYYDCYNEEIRLVGGATEREGRVEVCNNLRWGTVCDNQWTDNYTAVVCRFLGFSDLLTDVAYYSSERYGKGAGPVLMDYVNCTGSEGNLWRGCTHLTHYFGCSHSDDVGVQCQPARCSDGQLRLTDGPVERYGRLEICSNRRWETFPRSRWSPNNAFVACIELGFQSYRYSPYSPYYGNGGGPRHQDYFQCIGTEHRLFQCKSFNETVSRSQSSDVGIYCREAYCSDGEIRLMEGKKEWEGRLEICIGRRWGTVGANGWTQTNSDVVCNALGYDITNEPANQSTPMAPSKPLHYHSIQCSSRDLSLHECGFTKYTDFRKTFPHAIVKCQEPKCKDGDLRLVGGASETEGRLEICFNKRWGTIDGEGWTHTDTQVACRQLRYSTAAVLYTKTERKRYGASQSLPVFMTLVGCYGTEDNITDCSYHEFEYSASASTITTSMDISITCTSDILEPSSPETVAKSSMVANASLSISVILAVAVICLVAALIVIFVMNRKKNRAKRENLHRSHDDPGTSVRYSSPGIHFSSKNETISLDEKMQAEDLPAESYEEVEAPNALPIPSKPQPKQAQNKPISAPQKADSTRYSQGANSRQNVGPKPAAAHPQRPSQQGWNQQQRQQHPPPPRSDSPEAIYECPD